MNTKTNKVAHVGIIRRLRQGDSRAMAELIENFQDMAVGLAYAWTGNADIAREIAQEAFLDTHLNLYQLNDPAAFPAWFRQVVIKHCDRATRRRQIESHWLREDANTDGPEFLAAASQEQEQLRLAIAGLSTAQRQVVALQYFAELTGNEIAAFLQIPLSTVKKRLRLARKKLQEEAENLMKDTIDAMRPSRTKDFSTEVQFFIAVHAGDDTLAAEMLLERPDLANAQQDWDPDLAWQRVLPFPSKATALITTVELNNLALARTLLDAGADPDGTCGCATGEPPLWAAAMMNRARHLQLLLDHGADPNIVSAAGNTPLHVAAMRGYEDIVNRLVAAGADCNVVDGAAIPAAPLVARSDGIKVQRSPADWAKLNGHVDLARALGSNEPTRTAAADEFAARFIDGSNRRVLQTGIKALDFFTPIPAGGLVRVQFAAGVGMLLLIAELISRFSRMADSAVVWTGFAQPPFGSDELFAAELAEFGIARAIEPHIVDYRQQAEQRRAAFEEGVNRAIDLAGQGCDVLVIVLSTEGFENDVEANLPRLRLASPDASITALVVTPFRREPPPLTLSAPFDVHITFDRRRSNRRLYPSIYPQHSFSTARFNADHEPLRQRVIECLAAADAKDPQWDRLDLESTDIDESQVARHLLLYLSQPFKVTEPLGGLPGEFVPADTVLATLARHLPPT